MSYVVMILGTLVHYSVYLYRMVMFTNSIAYMYQLLTLLDMIRYRDGSLSCWRPAVDSIHLVRWDIAVHRRV